MATHRRRGTHARTLARRQQIVDAGLAVFSSSGFHGASLRTLAERAGLSQAGLLHHYPSKKHLLQAVLTWRDNQARRQLGEPAPGGLDLIRCLIAPLAATRPPEIAARTRELVRLHVIVSAEGSAADHPIHCYVSERHLSVLEVVRRAFEDAAASGQLRRDVDCASAARTLIALMDGLQVQWLLHPDQVDMAGDLRRCLQPWLTVDL